MPVGGGAGLLDPRLLARLETLQLSTRRRLAGSLTSEHRSPRYGSSIDFADYRDYHPGDDFRRIDYHALARLDSLLIRLYEAEDDLVLRLLVDTSGSMAMHGKLEQAVRLAAALGFVGLVRRDPVSVHTFPFDHPAPRYLGRGATSHLFDHLASLSAGGTTALAAAVSGLLSRPGPAGLTVVISDLLTAEWDRAITKLPSRGGDLIIVHVLAREEMSPPQEGDVELVDRETGERVGVSLSTETVAQYEASARQWLDDVAARCLGVGAGYVRVMADDELEPLLLGAWRRAGVLR
jgi:uncharacterized protein (DUF58 family)